jgi:hypothetical protein
MVAHEGIKTQQEHLIIISKLVGNVFLINHLDNDREGMHIDQNLVGGLEGKGNPAHKDIDQSVLQEIIFHCSCDNIHCVSINIVQMLLAEQ